MKIEEAIETVEYARAFNKEHTALMRALDVLIDCAKTQLETKSPCQVCGYGGRHLDAPPCAPSLWDSGCPAHPKLPAKEMRNED